MWIIIQKYKQIEQKQSMKEDLSDHRQLYDKYASSSNHTNIVTQSYSTSIYAASTGNEAAMSKQSSYKISNLPIIYDTTNRSGTPTKYESSSRVIYAGSASKQDSAERAGAGTAVGASVPKYDSNGVLSYTSAHQAQVKSGPTNIRNIDYGYVQIKGQTIYEVSPYNKNTGPNSYTSSLPHNYNPDLSGRTIIAGLAQSKPSQYKVSSSYTNDYKLQNPTQPSYDNKIEAKTQNKADIRPTDSQQKSSSRIQMQKVSPTSYYQTTSTGGTGGAGSTGGSYQTSTNYMPSSTYTSSSANITNTLANRLSNIVGYEIKPNQINSAKAQTSKQQMGYKQEINKAQNPQKPTTPAYPSSYSASSQYHPSPTAHLSSYNVPSQSSITGVDLSTLGYGNSIAHSPTAVRTESYQRVSQNTYAIPTDMHYVGSSPTREHVDLSELGYRTSPHKQVDPGELEYRRLPGGQVGFYVKPPAQYMQIHQPEYQGVGIDLAYPSIRPPAVDLSQLGYGTGPGQQPVQQITQVTQAKPASSPMPQMVQPIQQMQQAPQQMAQQMTRQVIVQQMPQAMDQSKSRSRLNISHLSSQTVPKVQYDRCVNQCKNWQTKYNQLYLKYMNLATTTPNQPSSMEADALRQENYRLKLALRQQEERRRQMLPLLESKFADMVNNQRQATIREAMLLIERYKLQSKQNRL